MAGKTTTHSDAVLNVLRNVAVSGVAAPHVGLFSVAPANDAAAGTELSGNGYARQPVTFGAPGVGVGSERKILNANEQVFGPAATDNWAAAVAFGIFSAATAGTLLYWNTLTAPKTNLLGDSLRFPVGSLEVTED